MKDKNITGLTDDKGQPKDSAADIQAFNKEYDEMLEVEHEIECGSIKEEWLDLDKNVDLPHTLLAALSWMIEFSTEGLD